MNCLNYIAPLVLDGATSMRLFRCAGVLAGLTCCLLFSTGADAQDNTSKDSGFRKFPGTVVVEPLDPGVPLRRTAPGFLGIYGQKMGKTTDNKYYLILEGLQIPLFFQKIRWVKVAPIKLIENKFEIDNKYSWVYWGKVGQGTSPNFKIVAQDEINQKQKLKLETFWKQYIQEKAE